MDAPFMFTDVGPKGGTPVDAAGDAPQYQTGSTPQPTAGAPNAVSAPGGTRSHVGDGSADNRPHNDSRQPGL